MEGDDDVLEEDHVLVSQWHSESRDDTGEDVEKFSCSIEFMCFVDKTEEALVNGLSDHFTTRYQLN